MPDLSNKKILFIDLTKRTYEFKSQPDLNKYIGGLGISLKLLHQYFSGDPIIFAVGPLNGFFPFCSKTAVVIDDNGVAEDVYFGGRLSSRIKYAGIDAIVISGQSDEPVTLNIQNNEVSFKSPDVSSDILGLPGKKALIQKNDVNVFLDDYFFTPENFVKDKFQKKNLHTIVVTGTETFVPKFFDLYQTLYAKLLNRTDDLTIHKGTHLSCSQCPMGCERSRFGEIGGNVLLHSLVACQYAENIYSDVGIIFSCLEVLGYDYSHEDIESLPQKIEQTLKDLT